MANLQGYELTVTGRALLAKAGTGACTLNFTKVKLGADETSLNDLINKTDLVGTNIKQIDIVGSKANEATFTIIATVTNSGMQNNFLIRQVGIFAKGVAATNPGTGVTPEDISETLFAVAYDTQPDIIPAESITPYTRQFNANMTVTNVEQCYVTLTPAGVVTVQVLNNHNDNSEAHGNLIKRIFGSANATMESVKQKIEDWAKKVCLPLSGGVLTGNLNASGYNITADKFIGNATYTDNANAFSFGFSPNGRYRIFAKGKKNNNDKSNVVSLIVSNIGKHDGTFEGIYVVQISNWNNRASMKIVEIIPSGNTNFPPKFGYYEDDNYFYYGYYNTMYGGYGYITVLGRENEEQIYVDKYLDTPTKPDGWTQVEETSITTQSTMIAYLSEATPAMTSLDTNNYWTKNIDGLITQIAEVNLNEEQEIDVQFPISFPQKCLFVDTKIINEEKDTSINCDFHIIEKTVDGAKLLKVGTGSPKKIVVKAIGI